MNLLHDIFIETFWDRYYFSKTWRAYVEYVGSPDEKFTGKICFFHFSHSNINLNSYHDYEILKFIHSFYSQAYESLLPLMKYAIEKKFVMSTNSLDEYTFVIKFWNEDANIRQLFVEYIYQYSDFEFQFEDDRDIRFFELKINTQGKVTIQKITVYSERDLFNELEYIESYVERDNVFMTLKMKEIQMWDTWTEITEWILIKFNDPIRFSDSDYIMKKIYPVLELPFPAEELYLGFIEQKSLDNNLYYTRNYSIPA